jgi:hypothetical protein
LPKHVPAPASAPQPGQLQPLTWHCEQLVKFGVPEHDGTWKRRGGAGSSCDGERQQIWPVQSLLCMQLFGQVAAQKPLQQRAAVALPAQSDDVEHVFGQGVDIGFKQRPLELRLGSSAPTDVQQISPLAVLQLVSPAHAVGQLLAAVQMGVL